MCVTGSLIVRVGCVRVCVSAARLSTVVELCRLHVVDVCVVIYNWLSTVVGRVDCMCVMCVLLSITG